VLWFGIDIRRKYPIDYSGEMGLDEFELASDQNILGQQPEKLNRGRRALPAGGAVTLLPLARHGNLLQHPLNIQVASICTNPIGVGCDQAYRPK
jgi:hypothetical protein